MFDIVFISYNEANADSNWQLLKNRFPIARRVHGIQGIHNAHIAAANAVRTKMFWVVDGDSQIVDSFNFVDPVRIWKPEESVFVYKALNPINGLTYGNGGIKLLPREATINMSVDTVDMTTSIGNYFTAVDEVASITDFNTDPFNTWRSAFRECVKLSSKVIARQISTETEKRLEVWCTQGFDKKYGKECISGALAGREYGQNESNSLLKINDYQWLRNYYEKNISKN